MEIKRGIPVSPGLALAPALVMDTEGFRIPQRFIDKKHRKDEVARLKEALKEKDLSKEAAVALGNIGRDGIPVLVEILKTSTQPDLQAAAAKGLGQVGGLHGDASVVPPLLEMLVVFGLLAAAWYLLQVVLLPRLGVST